MLIALMLVELMDLGPNTAWYKIVVILCFAASVFSSIPYKNKDVN